MSDERQRPSTSCGMQVNGFAGAIAALAIGVVSWPASWIAGLFSF